MMRRIWMLVLSLICFVLVTMIGYLKWTDQLSLRSTFLTSVHSDRNPSSLSPAAVQEQLKPSLLGGDKNDFDGIPKPEARRIFQYIVAPNSSSWTCNTKSSNTTPPSGEWQVVVKNNTYVYSAYLDPRFPNLTVVRVFGIIAKEEVAGNSLTSNKYYCMTWSQDKALAMVTEATLLLIGRDRSSYSAVQFQCSYNGTNLDANAVAVTTSECSPHPNYAIRVTNLAKQRHERDFTVCLSGPLKHGYDNFEQFVEWIEINLKLGAEHFYIYDYSIGKELVPYIKYYQSKGIMDVVPWRIPLSLRFDPERAKEFVTFTKLWNYGQEILIPDCLYRNMYTSRHVVYQDVDELIVPRQRDLMTWSEMIETSGCNSSAAAVYVARNSFFMHSAHLDSEADLDNREMSLYNKSMLLANQREDYVYNINHRSKYIAVPDQVILPYIHTVPQLLDQREQCVLSPEVGLLHHYRLPPRRRGPDIVDNTLDKYREKVNAAVQRVHKQVNKTKG